MCVPVSFKTLLLTLSFGVLLEHFAFSQLVINNTVNAADGVQNVLLGTGVTANNISFQGANEQVGAFTCTNCGLGIGYGLVMGTGNVNAASGPNNSGNTMLGPPDTMDGASDPDLAELSGMDLNNTAVLEFDFTPTGDSVFFNYVFGSEEYPEWVGSINDAFGFFLSGPGLSGPYSNNAASIALLPNSTTTISINNVNDIDNSSYYVDNTFDVANIQADGFTTVLTAFAAVECGSVYHIKMAIGDASDYLYDSWVFLEAGSFQSNQLAATYTAPNLSPSNGGMYEGCDPANITFTRSGNLDIEQIYDIVISGVAQNGVDFEMISPQVFFGINESSVSVPLIAIQDGVLEGQEIFNIMLVSDGCANSNTNIDIAISDLPELQIVMTDVTINCGQQAILTPVISGGLGNYYVAWDIGINGPTLSTYPNAPVSYPFTVTDTCGVAPFDGIANVLFVDNPAITVDIGQDIQATCLDEINIASVVSGGFGAYSYVWSANGNQLSVSPSVTFFESLDQNIQLIVTDDCGDTGSDDLQVIYPPTPVDVALGPDFSVTCLDQNTIVPAVSGGVGSYTYQWSSGVNNLGAADELQITANQNISISLNVEDECGNVDSDVILVNVPAVPVLVDLGIDQSVTCVDETILIPEVSGGVGTYSYQWSDQSGNIGNADQLTYQTSVNDQVALVVTDQCGNFESDAVVFSMAQVALNADIGDDLSVLCIDNVTLDGTVNGGIGNYSYSWIIDGVVSGNLANFSHQFNQNATVQLLVEDECGNSTSDILFISVPPVPVQGNAGMDIIATCLDASPISGSATAGVGTYNYTWSDMTGVFASYGNAQYTAQDNVTLTLTVTDQCGNSDTDQLNIFVPDVPVSTIVSTDTTICINDAVRLEGSATGGVGELTTSWTGQADNVETLTVAPEESTMFTFTAHDQCGNESSGSVVVSVMNVHPNFMAEYVDDFTVAFTDITPDAAYILWEFGDGTTSDEANPVHTFNTVSDWTVTLTAWAAVGCKRTIMQEYKPLGALFVPNCFTPDKDGINDVFFVYGHDLKSYKINVFTKWGDLIYASDDIMKPWDGSVKEGGYYVPDGVYPYIIYAVDERDNVIEKKGSIIVLR